MFLQLYNATKENRSLTNHYIHFRRIVVRASITVTPRLATYRTSRGSSIAAGNLGIKT
jgi:hypothetical protein